MHLLTPKWSLLHLSPGGGQITDAHLTGMPLATDQWRKIESGLAQSTQSAFLPNNAVHGRGEYHLSGSLTKHGDQPSDDDSASTLSGHRAEL